MLLNDATYLLDEALGKLQEIHDRESMPVLTLVHLWACR